MIRIEILPYFAPALTTFRRMRKQWKKLFLMDDFRIKASSFFQENIVHCGKHYILSATAVSSPKKWVDKNLDYISFMESLKLLKMPFKSMVFLLWLAHRAWEQLPFLNDSRLLWLMRMMEFSLQNIMFNFHYSYNSINLKKVWRKSAASSSLIESLERILINLPTS